MQRDLGTAVGYSYARIARLENDERLPDPAEGFDTPDLQRANAKASLDTL